MEKKKNRPYTSVIRKRQALETRNRIADAAEELIKADGYERATISAIASSSNVSAQTVYSVFGSKAGILVYLLARRISAHIGTEDAQSLRLVPAGKSAAETLAGMARRRNAQQQETIDSLGGFSSIYPELHDLVVNGDKVRRRLTKEYLTGLETEEKKLFRPENRTNARKLDLIMALTDTTFHHYLSTMVSDWDDDLYEKVLVQLLRFVMREVNFD